MPYTKEERSAIWLDSFGIDYARKAKLLASHTPYVLASQFLSLRGEICAAVGEERCAAMEASLRSAQYYGALERSYAEKGIACVTYFSEGYPEALRDIPDPPLVLYCRGDVSLLGRRKFSIVGSRHTSPHILRLTERYARELSKAFVIVSGVADGGDAAALTGALEGGGAIAVLAYGFDFVYPECNAALLRRVEERGLAVTEYLPHEEPRGFRFPARNRILAALGEGVLVVSGGMKSGTRSTADHAYRYGRDVFAFPYAPGVSSGAGCNALLKQYAKLVDDLVDIAAVFGINLTETEEISLTDAERAVFAAVREGEAHITEICAKSGLDALQVNPVLTMLEMKNLIVACGGNRYAALK